MAASKRLPLLYTPTPPHSLLTARTVRDVRLAVVPHDGAVCICYNDGVEVGVARPLKEGDCAREGSSPAGWGAQHWGGR